MPTAAHVLRYAEFAVFVFAAVMAALRWVQRRGATRAWLAVTFGLLAAVVLASEVLPQHPVSAADRVGQKALVAVLLLFPYALYRFMATFERPPHRLDVAAHALVLAVLAGTVLVHRFPEPGDPRSPGFIAYLVLVLVEWTVLSGAVSVRLWRAGRGQPTVARRRMQLLASGAAALAVALVLAGVSPSASDVSVATLVVESLAVVSALLFLAGFAPPRALLRSWRARDLEALHGAFVGLARATSPEQVVRDLLPRLARIVGAEGAAVYREDGVLLGRTGRAREDDPVPAARVELVADVTQLAPDHLSLAVPGGRLELWTTAYTPYFGRDEFDLMRSVGSLLYVTLDRTYAHAREVAARAALDEAQRVAQVGSWRLDLRTGSIEASGEMRRLYDLPRDVIVTRALFRARAHPDDVASAEEPVAAAIASGGEFENEYRIVVSNGEVRWLRSRGRALTDDEGNVVGLLGTCQDVTEQKRTDRLRRDFVANAAHELRTPLTTVSGMASLLADQRDRLSPAELASAFDALGRQGERARELVTSLLDLSRLDAGAVPVQLRPVDVRAALAHATETAPPPVSARVTLDCPEGVVATSDADRLHQIVVNLLTNAYRYGGPDIVVAARAGADCVQVTVEDDGNGVPAALVEDLFLPFSRGASVTGSPGSGLGLAISHRLAAALGGELAYEPRQPHGATFTLRLRGGR